MILFSFFQRLLLVITFFLCGTVYAASKEYPNPASRAIIVARYLDLINNPYGYTLTEDEQKKRSEENHGIKLPNWSTTYPPDILEKLCVTYAASEAKTLATHPSLLDFENPENFSTTLEPVLKIASEKGRFHLVSRRLPAAKDYDQIPDLLPTWGEGKQTKTILHPVYYFLPKGFKDGDPILIHLHGVGGLSSEPIQRTAHTYSALGLGVFLIDLLAHIGELLKDADSAPEIEKSGLHTTYDENILSTLRLLQVLKNTFPKSKIGIDGVSRGGDVVALLPYIRTFVSDAPKPDFLIAQYASGAVLPKSLKGYDIPFLILSGLNDIYTPPGPMNNFYRQLKEAGYKHIYQVIYDASHGFMSLRTRVQENGIEPSPHYTTFLWPKLWQIWNHESATLREKVSISFRLLQALRRYQPPRITPGTAHVKIDHSTKSFLPEGHAQSLPYQRIETHVLQNVGSIRSANWRILTSNIFVDVEHDIYNFLVMTKALSGRKTEELESTFKKPVDGIRRFPELNENARRYKKASQIRRTTYIALAATSPIIFVAGITYFLIHAIPFLMSVIF